MGEQLAHNRGLASVDLVHVSGTAREQRWRDPRRVGRHLRDRLRLDATVTTTTAADGAYGVDVPDTVDRVTLTELGAPSTPKPAVTSTGSYSSATRRSTSPDPRWTIAVHVADPDGNPVTATVYVGEMGNPTR